VKIDARVHETALADLVREARDREAAGYDGLWTAETGHDPFVLTVPMAEHTRSVSVGTGIAVAFARSPMTTAYSAYDLQVFAEGRFLLGLGSQIRPHIERRFSMPWSRPAARMREYVRALRAIWTAWETGERLDFRGDFYTHTLMTPFFAPKPSLWGPPPVYLAAVGDHMTRVAGEVCDGLQPHTFTTRRYLVERTLPVLREGIAAAGRAPGDVAVSLSAFVVSGSTEEEMAEAARATREQIAFYGSTPAYHNVLALHGWEDLGPELNRLSKGTGADRWRRMGELIDDEVLSTFAVIAEPERLGAALIERWGGLLDRISFYAHYRHAPDLFDPAIEALRAA
jgi:probable F420-dependent oxidoreductase